MIKNTTMGYAVDYDVFGNEIFVPGIPSWFDQPKGNLSVESLKKGDVLVWSSNPKTRTKTHQFIRQATQGATTHVGIFVGEGCSIDASKRTGVERVRVSSLLKKYEVCYVMRWEGKPDEDLDKVVTCAEGYLGFRYAKLDALLLPIRRYALRRRFSGRGQSYITKILDLSFRIRKFLPSRNAIYCSQMVVEAYSKIGLFGKIHVDQAAFSPNDLISQNCFTYMGYISNKSSPNFHSHDILAPVLRYETRRWSIF